MNRRLTILIAALAAVALSGGGAFAWVAPEVAAPAGPDGTLIVDGSYVLNVGELYVNITNHGLIGSQYSVVSNMSDAPSAQWPGGSGIEYLFSAGLWVGGVKNGETLVSTGQYEREFRPRQGAEHTIYESRYGRVRRPVSRPARAGARVFEPDADDDGDGMMDEDPLNGLDDDGDGRTDEDYSQLGSQMMVCTMYDNEPISLEEYPDHVPLDLKVVQTAYAWEMEDVEDFIVIAYDITNVGSTPIEDLRVGMFVDADIGPRDRGDAAFDDMAGLFDGRAQAPNGLYESVEVAYMYDGNHSDPVPGYIGVMFRGPSSARHGIRSFQRYTGNRAYALGGDPSNDAERYQEMGKTRSDPNVPDEFEADYRMLATNGGFGTLRPGRSVHVEVVLACGDGLAGLIETCAAAQQAWEGAWYDLDDDRWTGIYGRETYACLEDYGYTLATFALSPFKDWDARFADLSCVPGYIVDPITPNDLELTPDGRHCIWVNLDNCDECEERRGAPCSRSNFFSFWNCSLWYIPVGQKEGCTGIGGKESVVRWITDAAPPPPRIRVWPGDDRVHLFWSDHPEHSRDLITAELDFESYRIWRADDWVRPAGSTLENGPSSDLWTMRAEFDLDNEYERTLILDNQAYVDTLPLGHNTGLDHLIYRPRCLDDPDFAGLEDAMREAFAQGIHDGRDDRISIRDGEGIVRPGMGSLVPWEQHPAVLDTFFWATDWEGGPGEISAKRSVRFYEYVDDEVHNGFLYFYSIVATDHDVYSDGDEFTIRGPGVAGDPSTLFVNVRPGTTARTTADIDHSGQRIFVYPNPATRESLAEFQQMSPASDDPTGVRVAFANLPRSRNLISIFTLGGDLVQTLDHDGTTGHGEITWNLVSRNGQQIVSGVYIYSVQPLDGSFERFIGKFVVIR